MKIYRARSSLVWGWIAIGMGALIAVVHVAQVGFSYAHGGMGMGVAFAALGYAAFLRPHIAAGEDRVELHNVTRIAVLPFPRFARVRTRWTMEIVGDDDAHVAAFAAPAPSGRAGGRRVGPGGADHSERPGDQPGTPSGDAAALVHDAWEQWRRDGGSAARAEGPAIVTRWDPVGTGLIALSVIAAAWGLFS